MSIAFRLPGQGEILGVEIDTFTVSDSPEWLTKDLADVAWRDFPLQIKWHGWGALALREIAREDYATYLRTNHWKAVRRWRTAIARHRCEVDPNHTGQLDVHHKTYLHLGCEPPEDLDVLCHDCHQAQHQLISAQLRESFK
jgi:hypothetical protein